MEELLSKYDLSDWLWTRSVRIDSQAIPHSHPKLTMHTRHRNQELLLLSTFVHEQYHWFEAGHPNEARAAIAELRRRYPDLAVGGAEGAADEASSYLHVIVCYAEYRKMQALVGPARAREVMEFWARDHYQQIYRLVIDDERAIETIVLRHGLFPNLKPG